MTRSFFDSNVIVYADDESSPSKKNTAIDLIEAHHRVGQIVVSLQVIVEYFSAATRKLRLTPEAAQRRVEYLARMHVVRFTEADVIAAIELHRLRQISFWDAMIVHAARISGAAVLYTEDLQHGTTISGVEIVNPFIKAKNR